MSDIVFFLLKTKKAIWQNLFLANGKKTIKTKIYL